MRVKRFVAYSVQEAAALVRTEFGPDAVILHTRRARRGPRFLFWRRPLVEVIAAVDQARPRAERRVDGDPAPETAPKAPAVVSRFPDGARPRPDALAREPAVGTALLEMRRELAQIRQALAGEPGGHGPRGPAELPLAWPGALQVLFERLVAREVTEHLAAGVVAEVQAAGSEKDWEEGSWVWQEAERVITRTLPCEEPWDWRGAPKIVPLVGPTGVGKTTTVAKIAANCAVLGKRRVALITVDTYRIAAVEQLKTYADIMGLTVDVALTPQDLRSALDRRRGADLILVDTAGRSHRNRLHMVELKGFLEVMQQPAIHLVVSAATRLNDLLDVVEEFGIVSCERLIVTKLDETTGYGMLYNLGRLTEKKIAYVTNGQSVPDDIEVAEPAKIAGLILGDAP